MESLKSFASGSASDHTSAFLSGPAGGDGGKIGSGVSAPELSLQQTKKFINVAVAGPAANTKHEKEEAKYKVLMDKVIADLGQALDVCRQFEKETTDKKEEVPGQVTRYRRMLLINKEIAEAFLDSSTDEDGCKERYAACKELIDASPATPGPAGLVAPGTPAARPWHPADDSSPSVKTSSPSPGTPGLAASATPGHQGPAQQNPSQHLATKGFVAFVRTLPLKYAPCREIVHIRAWPEMVEILGKMADAESIEDLDILVSYWQKGLLFVGKLISVCKESAKALTSAIANHKRAAERSIVDERKRLDRPRMQMHMFIFRNIHAISTYATSDRNGGRICSPFETAIETAVGLVHM